MKENLGDASSEYNHFEELRHPFEKRINKRPHANISLKLISFVFMGIEEIPNRNRLYKKF